MKPKSRNTKHRHTYPFAPGNNVAVPVLNPSRAVADIRVPKVKKPVKLNPRIIDIGKLFNEINRVAPGTATDFAGNGLKLNRIEIRISEGRASYEKTVLRFSNFRELLDNLLLDRVLSLTKQQKQYLITGYNRIQKKNKRNEHHKF